MQAEEVLSRTFAGGRRKSGEFFPRSGGFFPQSGGFFHENGGFFFENPPLNNPYSFLIFYSNLNLTILLLRWWILSGKVPL